MITPADIIDGISWECIPTTDYVHAVDSGPWDAGICNCDTNHSCRRRPPRYQQRAQTLMDS